MSFRTSETPWEREGGKGEGGGEVIVVDFDDSHNIVTQ